MASKGYQTPDKVSANGLRIGIVHAQWNSEITSKLLEGARSTLEAAGGTVLPEHIIQVPGSFELPMGARILLGRDKFDAIICLGCLIKGDTEHDTYIAQSVAQGLTMLSLQSNTACLFGVITALNMEQAIARAGGDHGNKGSEAAQSAIQMALIKKEQPKAKPTIGFKSPLGD
ncbi:MAG: 6,7-dimethyl-8-ribityllumazine synthase [Saprospiraceae bacterium]|nr:6,7-dimethyl-8-ribityllumazine synthase [Saprospiraceae bacterium]MCB9318880.1 6,7-dimethyl-8-ribityllumazine synthase [Lewinellaceae bacterium]